MREYPQAPNDHTVAQQSKGAAVVTYRVGPELRGAEQTCHQSPADNKTNHQPMRY